MPSLPEAVESKYGDDCPNAEITETACVALTLKRPERKRLPSVLILSECDIEEAGNEEDVEKTCEGVRELDLSKNKIKHWNEVLKILKHLPCLGFLNLSYNNFENSVKRDSNVHLNHLTRLVLNGTSLPWDDIHTFLEHAPILEELHICMNRYHKVIAKSGKKYKTVRRIHFNNNPITEWKHIEELGSMFPSLEVLVLADCPISKLNSECKYGEYFPCLQYLSLNSSKISTWESVENINKFPKISELRLQQCPLYESYSENDRRLLTIGWLWRIQRLNGGALINPEEREIAERAYIRHYRNREDKSERYKQLIEIHGEVDPLVEINMKPQKMVCIHITYGQVEFDKKLNVYSKVLDVKKAIAPEIGLPHNKMRIFYQDKECYYSPDELKINTKQIYTIGIVDGDQLIVHPKMYV